ncbi:MAG: hypothetical protein F6J98_02280 [Moorea sp. SIO4G2]|nr:hypothetical protein [Moorena sp. SIO4G2]NEQ83394.1 hypothetical protein [Moorena sp. SIO2I5]
MYNYCVTGSRKITLEDYVEIALKIKQTPAKSWHVGDAKGVDACVRETLRKLTETYTIYHVAGRNRWNYAERSIRMLKNCQKQDGNPKLLAFLTKPCPPEVTPAKPFCGAGSGTWATVAMAKKMGIEIEVYYVHEVELPNWLTETQICYEQLSLFG